MLKITPLAVRMQPMTPYEQLDALYSTLPSIPCKKLCGFGCCGPLQASGLETKRVAEKTGLVKITDRAKWHDPANFQFRHLPYYLNKDDFYRTMEFWQPDQNLDCQFFMQPIGTCRVYALRPMICRLWGMVDHPAMRCSFGCVPDRWVTHTEAKEYFQKVVEIQEEARKHEQTKTP